MTALKLSRPTVDSICTNEESFFKYMPQISSATGVEYIKIVEQYGRMRNGL